MMNINFLNEPELEFGGGGTHLDFRFGLMQHGPLDRDTATAPKNLNVGIVGTNESIEGVREWLENSQTGISAKDSRLNTLFPPFPGFTHDTCFGATLVFHDRWIATINKREIDNIIASSDSENIVYDAVDLFLDYATEIVEKGGPMILICAPSIELLAAMESAPVERIDPNDLELDESTEPTQYTATKVRKPYFHDVLKASGMKLGIPIQMVRPHTYKKLKRIKKSTLPKRTLQDEATRAWNFHTALYYKAGGVPWRLIRKLSDLSTCFVGISFYKTLIGDRMLTSVAQVFNERGEGVIVKGAPAKLDKVDRQPHLSSEDSNTLLKTALYTYRREHKTFPARVVIHKTSKLSRCEIEGFTRAAENENIELLDLLSIRRSFTRLFRTNIYPPLRGTYLEMDAKTAIIYMRGSVNFYRSYPGLYVPRPLEFSVTDSSTTTFKLAEEIFALSKLNWNNTQFDGGEPITVRAARRVGDILKCVEEDGIIQPSYRYFM